MNQRKVNKSMVAIPVIICILALGCTAAPASTATSAAPPGKTTTMPLTTIVTPPSTTATAPPATATTTAPPITTTIPPPTTTTNPPTPTPTSSPYAISIVQPPTFTVGTHDVTVVVQVSGFDLIDKIGQSNVPGQGHINYSIYADSPGTPQVLAPGTYIASAATSYTWKGLIQAVYTFSVELVNNDNTPLVPPVVASKQVTVYPG